MEEHSLYTHYLSCRKGVPDRELSENTKKIIALVESEDFLEANRYMLSDLYTLMEIVWSARADVHYKLELLNGIMAEFKDTKDWKYRGEGFMEAYEPFCLAVDLMKSADNVFFTLTKVTRGENNIRSYDNNYPEFSSVDEISRYLESRFDKQKDSEDDSEWYIAKRYENNIKTSHAYLLSKCGTIWKCGREYYNCYCNDYDIESVGNEIISGRFIANDGDIFVCDSRPFHDICHMLYATCEGEDVYGIYVENGKLKTYDLEYHINDFEDFAVELRSHIQEDMSKLSEQERILQLIQQKHHSMSRDDGFYFLEDIVGMAEMPIEMVKEKFLK